MTSHDDLELHPPGMAEMAGGVLDSEHHATSPVEAGHPEDVPLGLAQLEAETEE
jgi:hypothetical protein